MDINDRNINSPDGGNGDLQLIQTEHESRAHDECRPGLVATAHITGQAAQQVRDFLQRVLPWPKDQHDLGFINIHWKDPQKQTGMPGYACRTIDEFYSHQSWLLSKNWDIYFCLSCQAKPGKLDKRGKPLAARHAKDAHLLKALWLDLDGNKPDQPEKGYPNKKAAFDAFRQFLKDPAVPSPSAIVDSGNGYHIYWISKTPLIPTEWVPYAQALWALVQKHGLKCDPVTTDAARVLRVPGTFNYKTMPPRPVRLLGMGKDYDFPTALGALAQVGATTVTSPSLRQSTPIPPAMLSARPSKLFDDTMQETDNLGAGLEFNSAPLSFDEVVKHCPHFKHAAETGGAGYGQGLWMMDVLACTFMQDGLAHV